MPISEHRSMFFFVSPCVFVRAMLKVKIFANFLSRIESICGRKQWQCMFVFETNHEPMNCLNEDVTKKKTHFHLFLFEKHCR